MGASSSAVRMAARFCCACSSPASAWRQAHARYSAIMNSAAQVIIAVM